MPQRDSANSSKPLIVLLLWLAFLGWSIWQHAQRADQPPIHDAATYYAKAFNFWTNVDSARRVNPLDLEPTFRPPGTVLMSYPFGFDTDYRAFYFRSVFLPIALLVAGVLIAGYAPGLSRRSAWYLVATAAFFSTLPLFYYFQVSPEFPMPSYWGLVDNFLGGMSALAAGACIRSVAKRSVAWVAAAALLSSFCLLIKPSGALIMALIGMAWLGLATLRLRSEWSSPPERRRTIRWLLQGSATFALLDALVLAASLSSLYLSRQNLAYGNAAIAVMQTELELSWGVLLTVVHTGLGYAFVVWALLSGLLITKYLRRRRSAALPWNGHMLVGLVTASGLVLAFGVWFWIFGSGGVSQIRYFLPFALVAVILAVPVIVQLVPAMSRSEAIVLAVPMAFSIINICMLLAQRDPSPEWQRWAGVNLTSGGKDAVTVQARNFADAVKRDGRDSILYSMPIGVTDAEFQAAIDYARIASRPMPVVSIRRPVDWQRPTTYRLSEMIGSGFLLFEPVPDPGLVKTTLSTTSVDDFDQERALFQAWATRLTADDGVEVASETPQARVLRVTNAEKLEARLDELVEAHRWRAIFTAANPRHHWSEKDLADALAQHAPALENIDFADRIELRALSVDRTGREVTVGLWWKPLPALKEHDWFFFIHSIDEQGNIVLNKQIPLDIPEMPPADDTIRFNSISFTGSPRDASSRLAVGFYRPDGSMLVADKGTRDWNGKRVIVPLP